jgi:Uma2 family endonuclease
MAVTPALVPVDEYLRTTYEADCEYLDGEIVERNMGEPDHAGLQGLIASWLAARRKQLGIHVFPEMRVQVASTRFRVPDIAVTTHKIKTRILREPPFLCVEILSPEDRASRMEAKIDEYLNFGVPHVWLIDPRGKRAWSYTREGKREVATVLATGDPKIELPILDLFSELDEEIDLSEE